MRNFYLCALASALAMASVPAYAADEGVTIIADPVQGAVLEEFPEYFSLTFEGPASIASSVLVGNPVNVTDPKGNTMACTATWDNAANKVTLKTIPAFQRDILGDYTVTLKAGGVIYVDEEGNKTDCSADTFTYTVDDAPAGPVRITLDPPNRTTLEEFPETFTMTFTGPESIKKNLTTANPVMVFEPGSDSGLQCTAAWDNANNTITITTHKDIDRTLPGVYIVRLRKDGVQYIFADRTEKAEERDFFYDVIGKEPDVSVQYDLQLTGTTPNLAKGFNRKQKTLETLQLVFNGSCLEALPDAKVTITGPNYKHSAIIRYNMGTAANTSTWMKASFPMDPIYNGTYTLTIPEGVLGDARWIANPEQGHANAAVSFEFEVTGGEEWSEDKRSTTFNPENVTPAPGARVEALKYIMLEFPEPAYYDETAVISVGYKWDPSLLNFDDYGTARISGAGTTNIRLDLYPVPSGKGEFEILIPQGTFRNAEVKEEATDFNSTLYYYYQKRTPTGAKVVSTEPANSSDCAGFGKGEGITIVADPKDLVEKMDIIITKSPADENSEEKPEVILDTTSTAKNAEGDICWINEGEDLIFSEGYKYKVNYILYGADDTPLAQGSLTLNGAEGFVLVEAVSTPGAPSAVYNLQGMPIGSDLNALPSGLYIIGGRKVVIRK